MSILDKKQVILLVLEIIQKIVNYVVSQVEKAGN